MSSDTQLIYRTRAFDPEQMARQGRKGGQRAAATRDSAAVMAHARAALRGKFERMADPTGLLPPEERERRAAALRRDHFADLGRRGAEARRRKRDQMAGEVAA